jgi:oxygen-independent coproporphyrinogen III oxidase
MNDNIATLSADLIRKYAERDIPYYTSYPTGGQWNPDFNHQSYMEALKKTAPQGQKVPMSLYVHFPFCPELCYYCCCVKTITKKRDRISRYLQYLHREIDMLVQTFEKLGIEPDVRDVAFGGGTPTYMELHEYDDLLKKLGSFVDISTLDEFILEVDPRTVDENDMRHYLASGVSRLSFGIQDFDDRVQKAINRVQPYDMVESLIAGELRQCSVNFDLIYGLPFSNRESFKETVRQALQLGPDRLSVYNYDHTPEIHKGMKAINADDLPGLVEKSFIFGDTIEELLANGYQHIGLDHFAKPDDSLARAYNDRQLWRSLSGYTTHRDYFFEIGLGNSSVGSMPNYYTQNIKGEAEYYQSIDGGEFPVLRGYELSQDDVVRRDVIFSIVSQHCVDFKLLEEKHGINFQAYFKEDLPLLEESVGDGLVDISADHIQLTPLGKIFAHHVARPFDRYLRDDEEYVRTHAAILKEHKVAI